MKHGSTTVRENNLQDKSRYNIIINKQRLNYLMKMDTRIAITHYANGTWADSLVIYLLLTFR